MSSLFKSVELVNIKFNMKFSGKKIPWKYYMEPSKIFKYQRKINSLGIREKYSLGYVGLVLN